MTAAARRPTRLLAALATALVCAVACTDGGAGGDRADSTASARPEPSATSLPRERNSPGSPGSSTPSASESSAPADPEGAEEKVREAWARFFDPRASVEEKTGLVEDGEQNGLMVRGLATDPQSRELRALARSVTFDSSHRARVEYTLTRDGQPVRHGGPGRSVLQDGTWKLGLRTVCALTQLGKDVPRAPSCG